MIEAKWIRFINHQGQSKEGGAAIRRQASGFRHQASGINNQQSTINNQQSSP
jgi:hypothetical protein